MKSVLGARGAIARGAHAARAAAARAAHAGEWTLHVVNPRLAGEESVLACLYTLQAKRSPHHVVVIGTDADAERVRSLGLGVHSHLGLPASYSSGRGLGRHAAELARELGAARAVCVWGAATAPLTTACAIGMPGFETPRVIVETRPPPHRGQTAASGSSAWPDEVDTGAFADSTFVTVGQYAAQAWRAMGVRDVRTAPASCAIVEYSPEAGATREQVRAAMGFDLGTPLLGLLADPPERADARAFAFIEGLVYTTGVTVAGLVPAGGVSARRAARFVREHGRRWMFREWKGSLRDMIDVCDVLLCTAADAAGSLPVGPLLLSAAGYSGKPVIVPDGACVRELAAGGCPLVIAPDASMTAMTARLLTRLDAIAPNTATLRGAMPATDAGSFGHTIHDVIDERVAAARAYPIA